MKPVKTLWLVAILLLTAILAACGGKGPAPAATESNAALPLVLTNPEIEPTLGVEQMQATLQAAFQALGAQKSYRYRSTMLINGNTYHTMIEYMLPDKKHIVTDNGEFIVAGDKVYVKDGDHWKVSETLTAETFKDDLVVLTKNAENIQWLGREMLDGKAMQVIQFDIKAGDTDKESTQQFKLWVGEADGLPYKLSIVGSAASVDEKTGQTGQVQAESTLLFEYDPTIQIFIPVIK